MELINLFYVHQVLQAVLFYEKSFLIKSQQDVEEDAERGRYMQNLSKTQGKKDTKLKSEWVTFLIKIIAHGPE